MGNTPSSPQTTASPVARHQFISRTRRQPQDTTTQKPAALPHHRTAQLQHDPFPIPKAHVASPLAHPTTSAEPASSSASALVTSPSGDPTSPSSLRPTGGSPRRRRSLELPDLNRLSLTSMATPVPGRDPTVTSPVGRRSPLALGESYVPDTVQQGGVPSGTGKRVSLMSGTRAQHVAGDGQELVQDNPYFPAVPRAPGTPAALPNYSYSPLDTSAQYTEDVAAPTAQAAAVGTGQAQGGVPLLVSGLPQGSTPVSERVGAGDETPLAVHRDEGRQRDEVREKQQQQQQQRQQEPERKDEERAGLVPTLVTWNGGGKEVFVTGTFAENGWRTRLKMNKSTHDFSILLNLPPGTHRIKFIVDDHWRCSNDLQTATDGDGNLVNWLEVEVPRRGGPALGGRDEEEDWAQADWAQKVSSELDDDDPSLWTDEIPWALIEFQQMEEEALSDPPEDMPVSQHRNFRQRCATILSQLPVPPALPPHLNKVILNATPKELEGTVGGAAGDDNSILPVPNHVVLNHLTASAIKNDTLAVGTTTRYRRKYISTIYFKPVEDPL
ncbi:hypothetical protein QFC20_005531 [Naganishia adeliensis]|uniref:Uncharacterized protein n=1 Tax=Naganishia adeliensis TaxID=92952 RepID=A0ACC2VL27_9TREE|nr:hypothetical protein QFC20_005531 [Naganishia adeliensis]